MQKCGCFGPCSRDTRCILRDARPQTLDEVRTSQNVYDRGMVTHPGLLADAIVVVHVAFVGFATLGGLLVLRWTWLAWAHLPAALWAAGIELTGEICPLTPMENALRLQAGRDPYTGDFISRYVLPALYPEGLTRDVQILIGLGVLIVNLVVYAEVIRRLQTRALESAARR